MSHRGSLKQNPLGNPVASSPSIAGNMDAYSGVLENSIVQQWPTVKGTIGMFDRVKIPAANNKSDASSSPSSTAAVSPTTQAATRKLQDEKEQYATLTLPDGKSFKLPYMRGTDGPDAIDIRKLYDQAEVFTYDPGFTSTCSCYSAITFIDGPKGILLHRGYDIIDLVNHSDYTEVCYLLMYGELPTPRQKELHDKDLKYHRMIHEKLITFYKGFKSDAHPMAIMVGVVGALSAFYHDSLDVTNPLDRARSAYRLIAKMPTIAAIAYKTSIGQPIVYPRDDLTYAENLLYMLFALPTKPYVLQPAVVRAIEIFLILHADHEQNASTSTVRIAGSSHANPFACVASGIAALWGPAHGGANEAVINMLIEIGSVENIPAFISRCKDKNDTTRLMGFGHRVYKNFDPRARRMRQVCYDVLDALGIKDDPLLALAVELEKIALNDEYFVKRKLYPNVDFYSGIILRAIGIPVSMFTVLFAVARTAGWISQWKEMIENPDQKIGRPRQLYVGAVARPYISIDTRDEVIPDDQRLKPPPKGKIVSVHYQAGGES